MERMWVFFFSVLHVLDVHSSSKWFKAMQELSPNLVVFCHSGVNLNKIHVI